METGANGLGNFLQEKFGGKFIQSGDEETRADIEFSHAKRLKLQKKEDYPPEREVLDEVRKYFSKQGFEPMNEDNPDFLIRDGKYCPHRAISATYSERGDIIIITSSSA